MVLRGRPESDSSDVPTPIALTVEQWRATTPRERERFLVEVNDILNEKAILAPESRAHGRAKVAVLDRLGQHFSRIGRRIYLASEMSVHYPGEPVFVPDVLAVLDVDDPGDDDKRLAWVVAEECKGLDLVIEVLFHGDRGKDLVRNVSFYARLGIGEYFVYDARNWEIDGWWLPENRDVYTSIEPQLGRLHSRVLGLDLGVVDGSLRFYAGAAELPDSAGIIDQLGTMLRDLQQ
jgi:Uma2 family endonuclease